MAWTDRCFARRRWPVRVVTEVPVHWVSTLMLPANKRWIHDSSAGQSDGEQRFSAARREGRRPFPRLDVVDERDEDGKERNSLLPKQIGRIQAGRVHHKTRVGD